MKKILVILFVSILITQIYAQDENLELPDVSTEITGDSIIASKDSIPDFDDVLIVNEEDIGIVPRMPEMEVKDVELFTLFKEEKNAKSVYAEGQLGGGFPSLFKGDFSVYRLDGVNPFRLNFHHNSCAGYSGKSLNEGYNNRETLVSFEKKLEAESFDFTFGGIYETSGFGLQNKVENISNYDNDFLNGYGAFDWQFDNNFSIGTKIDADLNYRYADITSVQSFICPNYIKMTKMYNVTPSFYGNWYNDAFNVDFGCNYWVGGLNPCESKMYQRADVGFGLSWKNQVVKLYGTIDVVFGSELEGEPVVPPFVLGLDANLPVYFSNRKVVLKLEGGLDSYRNEIEKLEKQYRYTCCSLMPKETSEWFGKIDFAIPLKTSFTQNIYVDFRKTAFDNGRYYPDYKDETLVYGVYGYNRSNVTMLTTDFSFAYHYKWLSLTAGWHSNWIDVPALESSQMIVVSASIQNDKSKWGVNTSAKVGFGDNMPVPVLNLDSFVHLTPAVRIVFSAEDLINLFNQNTRSYAGQYIAQGGNVSILVKFFF